MKRKDYLLSPGHIKGLEMLAEVCRSTASSEVRKAIEERMLRFGLAIEGEEVVPVHAIAEAEAREATGQP